MENLMFDLILNNEKWLFRYRNSHYVPVFGSKGKLAVALKTKINIGGFYLI